MDINLFYEKKRKENHVAANTNVDLDFNAFIQFINNSCYQIINTSFVKTK